MYFHDIHNHILCKVDDGAKDEKTMLGMLDRAWQNGIRTICATPHFGVRNLHRSDDDVLRAYVLLRETAAARYPDMRLFLGNELRYTKGCVEWLDSGRCRTLNRTKYVLVDFRADESKNVIEEGLLSLLNAGYHPVFAHVERYTAFQWSLNEFRLLRDKGVLLQIDADSLLRHWGLRSWWISRELLKRRLADLICSDAHDLSARPPELKKAYDHVIRTVGEDYAQRLDRNAARCLGLSGPA